MIRTATAIAIAASIGLSAAAQAGTGKRVPFAGFFSYAGCELANDDGFAINRDGTAGAVSYDGRWTKKGDVITIKWVLRKGERRGAKKSEWRITEKLRLGRDKHGRYVLRDIKTGTPATLCKKQA